MGPRVEAVSGGSLDRRAGMFLLETVGPRIAECLAWASLVVAGDEAGQSLREVFFVLEGHGTDALDLQRLHEALSYSLVVGTEWVQRPGRWTEMN